MTEPEPLAPEPLVDALVRFFQEVEDRRFEARVWMLLDLMIRGPAPNISDSNEGPAEDPPA